MHSVCHVPQCLSLPIGISTETGITLHKGPCPHSKSRLGQLLLVLQHLYKAQECWLRESKRWCRDSQSQIQTPGTILINAGTIFTTGVSLISAGTPCSSQTWTTSSPPLCPNKTPLVLTHTQRQPAARCCNPMGAVLHSDAATLWGCLHRHCLPAAGLHQLPHVGTLRLPSGCGMLHINHRCNPTGMQALPTQPALPHACTAHPLQHPCAKQ